MPTGREERRNWWLVRFMGDFPPSPCAVPTELISVGGRVPRTAVLGFTMPPLRADALLPLGLAGVLDLAAADSRLLTPDSRLPLNAPFPPLPRCRRPALR